MAQEITIIVAIDTMAAIRANQLEGNIYLIDNLRREGSEGNGTGHLTTAIHGTRWKDGSQASEPLLNWLVTGVGSLPPSLPRNFHERQSRLSDAKRLNALTTVSKYLNKLKTEGSETSNVALEKAMAEVDVTEGQWAKIRDNRGEVRDLGLKLLNMKGEVVFHDQDNVDLSQLSPVLTDITGEAVDEGILYPAQYGTPIALNDGWYWSATAGTHKPGVYAYTMHFRLHRLFWGNGQAIWETTEMTYDAQIRVASNAMINGFTGGALGILPM